MRFLMLFGLVSALRAEDLQPLSTSGRAIPKAAAVANVATANADATYGQPEADLINELKTKVNALLAALRASGTLAP